MAELRTADGRLVARLTVARTFWSRVRGLIGRPALATDEGLLLPGANGVHMLFMRAPIDVAFVGRQEPSGHARVLALRHSLAPWRGVVWWVRGAAAAVELHAGALSAAGIGVGDRLTVDRRSIDPTNPSE
ncbi:MAG TPA: DUF192 domain-containing protein [Candidatus Limnocylindria bacterium]|nr:DUF192 domain-containing protein [Candidatus Limnocylindria bacterium]